MHYTIPLSPLIFCVTSLSLTLAMSSFPIFDPTRHIPPSHAVSLPPLSIQSASPFRNPFPVISRRQMEVLPQQFLQQDKEPTCSELRSMWRQMRRMSRQMEFSNEIPKVPDPFVASAARYSSRPTKYPDPNPYSAAKSSSHKEKVFQKSQQSPFGKIIRDPAKVYDMSHVASNRPMSMGFNDFDDRPGYTSKAGDAMTGSFADYSMPEESLGVYGTVVNSPEEKARYRSQSRRPQQFGLSKYRPVWSGREGDTSGIGRVPFMGSRNRGQYDYGNVVKFGERTGGKRLRSPPLVHPLGVSAEFPQEIGQRSNGGARVERIDKAGKLKNSCLRLQNKICRRDIDCYCNGSPRLFCGGNKCRPVFKAPKYGNQKWSKNLITYPFEQSFTDFGPKRDPAWLAIY